MARRQKTLMDDARMSMVESIDLTVKSITNYGQRYKHWAMAWSGGKDSSALVTLVVHLIESGRLPRPETLTVLYADTRLELTPLYLAAQQIRNVLGERGYPVREVMADLDKRFMVYLLGRGVPPPNNNTLRWCTNQIKVQPMANALQGLFGERGEKLLMLTGVRQGESATRDGRIAMSCGRNGAECGQGWYQETLPESLCDTLAPLLHWRVCHIWDWLRVFAPSSRYGSWPTSIIADAYGGEEAEEINARTGCVCCPLASKDTALLALLRMPQWSYLKPLLRLRALWVELREPRNRLRQPGGETRKDGTLSRNQNRMGPITLEARIRALDTVLAIQSEVNESARKLGRPEVDILNAVEETRIRELIALNTWPDGWSGTEPVANQPYVGWSGDGTKQPLLLPQAEGAAGS